MVGASDQVAAAAQDLRLAERISRYPLRDGSADLVALLGQRLTTATIDAAVGSLAPDGVLYIAVDRRQGSRTAWPSRLVRELKRRDLLSIAVYWVKPDPERAEMYLPSRPASALRWYLDHLYTPISPLRRVARSVVGLVAGMSPRLFWLVVPSYAVVARRRGHVDAAVVAASNPGRRAGSAAIMLTDNGERSVLLPFEIDVPRTAIKVAKRPEFGAKMRHEHEVLVQLHARLDATLAATLPHPIRLTDQHGLIVTEESVVDGASMLSRVGTWPFDRRLQVRLLRESASWLLRFHEMTLDGRVGVSAQESSRWLSSPIDDYVALFPVTPVEREFHERLRRLRQSLAGDSIPIAWQHNDFGVNNIWWTPHDLRVIDWEGGRAGPVLSDLLYFAVSWNDTAHGVRAIDDKLRGFRRLFIDRQPTDFLARAARFQIKDYCRRLEVSSRLVPMLLAVTWSRLALDRHARSRALGEGFADPRVGNEPAAYIALMARHAEELLATWR